MTTRPGVLVHALPAAIEAAAEHLPRGAIVENEVARCIAAGRATRRPFPGRELGPHDRAVHSGQGWVALVTRARSPLTGRPSWLVLWVEREEAAC